MELVGNLWGQTLAMREIIVFYVRTLCDLFCFTKDENPMRNILEESV